MLIRNYKIIVPLLAFLCLGSNVSAQTADQFGGEPIVSKEIFFDSEQGVSGQIQDKLQEMELQTKVLSSLPISLDIKTDAIETEGSFLETAKSAMLSPEALFLAKLEQLQADIKNNPIDTLRVEPQKTIAIASKKINERFVNSHGANH